MRATVFYCLLLIVPFTQGGEHKIHALADLLYTSTDGLDSYVSGDYGKFRYDDGDKLALSQAALSYHGNWGGVWSALVVALGYADGTDDGAGFSEAYLQYKSLPFDSGYRIKLRAGLLFPKISMTNVLTGWTSPYTINYSAINTWVGEELRHQGIDISVIRLGKFSRSEHDLELSVSLFQGNDPAGGALSWHGWTSSNRTTLRHEKFAFPNSDIGFVPDESDIYLELDDRTGYHVNTQWTWHGRAKVLLGYYDNRGDPKVVENTQWAWETKFYHVGLKWQFDNQVELIAQYLTGDTLMQSSSGSVDLVNNDYDSVFLMLSKKVGQHRITGRIEDFSVTDNDAISFDNNNEDGNAVTVNYSYRLGKQWFLQSEFSWLDSDRPSRQRRGHGTRQIEKQLQMGVRYYY